MERTGVPRPVDVHRANIRAKLKLEDGAAVTRHAIRWGESNRLSASSGDSHNDYSRAQYKNLLQCIPQGAINVPVGVQHYR